MHFSIDRTVHTTAFDKPVVDHWLERKIAQTAAGSTEKARSDDRPHQRRARYRLNYIPLPKKNNNKTNTKQIQNKIHKQLLSNEKHSTHLLLYGVGHMAKDRSDSERGNPMPPHGHTFRLAAIVILYVLYYRQDSTHHGVCYTSRGTINS